jgi:protein-S-isoprenylcysteine O-methyltransferase Ste14
MKIVDTVIAAIWVAFWVYWLAAAVRTKATHSRSSTSFVMRIVVIVVVVVLLRAGAVRGTTATIGNPWLLGTGLALFLLGIALAVWARAHLGQNWGAPMSEKVDPEMVATGPYRYIRHPIYSGIILAMIGSAVAVGPYWLIPVVLLGGYFVYSAIVEERTMGRLFPEVYPAYKCSTKMLIPFVF